MFLSVCCCLRDCDTYHAHTPEEWKRERAWLHAEPPPPEAGWRRSCNRDHKEGLRSCCDATHHHVSISGTAVVLFRVQLARNLAALWSPFVCSSASVKFERSRQCCLQFPPGAEQRTFFCRVLGTEMLHTFLWSDLHAFSRSVFLRNVDIGGLFGDALKKALCQAPPHRSLPNSRGTVLWRDLHDTHLLALLKKRNNGDLFSDAVKRALLRSKLGSRPPRPLFVRL